MGAHGKTRRSEAPAVTSFRCQEKGCDNQFLDAPMYFHSLKKHFFICPSCRPKVHERYLESLE